MNTVKIWAVWSWIERSNGAFYFDDLDELVELCSSKRLQTVIKIIPEGAPYWLERLHPDARYQAENGMALEFSGAANLPSGGWPGLCREQIGVDRCDSLEIAWNDSQYRGAKFFGGLQRQYVSVCEDDVDILATFSDGEPAVCKRPIGQGAVAWIGTYCSLSQQKVKVSSPLTRWAYQQGYAAITRLCAPEGTLVRLHRSANDRVLAIAVNYNHQPIEVSVVGSGSEEGNALATTTVVVPARDGTSFLL